MKEFDYIRLTVAMNSKSDVSTWSADDIKAAFWLCAPPYRTLEQWAGIVQALTAQGSEEAPQALTEEQKMAANKAVYDSLPEKMKVPKDKAQVA